METDDEEDLPAWVVNMIKEIENGEEVSFIPFPMNEESRFSE
jgi:hypothetical protein